MTTAIDKELREILVHSQKFINWSPAATPSAPAKGQGHPRSFEYTGKKFENLISTDPHLTPEALGEAWGVSAQTIRNIFADEPGVLRIGQKKNGRRGYVSLRIPESVVERVHKRLSAVPQ
jgi:hypothetical protein